jgi:uncharacterized protein YcbK (DUF882 family)
MLVLRSRRVAATVAATALLFGLSGELKANANNGDTVLSSNQVLSAAILAGSGQRFTLHLHHLHTGETLDVVYRVGNQYVPSAIDKLNHFLRDHRTNDVSSYDPKEFDLLHAVMEKLHRPDGVIDVVCGYRTPWSNEYLRGRAAVTGVAKNSQHTLAKAIDIRIPGVQTRTLRDVAMSLQGGGVGYYPVSQFVHVDVGPVRHWTFAGAGD